MKLENVLDLYSLRARLQPALLALFPLFVTVAAWVPALYKWGAGLISLATACGVTVLFAHIARQRGRQAEQLLYQEWGGKPTTIWLRHRSEHLDAYAKRRYHAYLIAKVPDWSAPTLEEECRDPAEADRRYEAAVTWLIANTRDQPLVFKENISYGFRRNLYGLRPFGLAASLLSALGNAFALYHSYNQDHLSVSGLAALSISLLLMAAWLFLINKAWVRDAADAYARALIHCCDSAGK